MKKLNLSRAYPYAYETHLHTSQGSACARSSADDMARACREAGYTGIIVTDHFFYGNTAVDRNLPWEEWVEGYCSGYELAKKTGDKIGLQVFFGWESGYQGTDFLIYGLDKQWLLEHPEIRDATVEEQYGLVHRAGGLVIHAHPFREEFYIPRVRLFPDFVDGVEVANASHAVKFPGPDGVSLFDRRAMDYALEHDFPRTGGSDIHSVDLIGGGMAFAEKLNDIRDYIAAVMDGKGRILQAELIRD